MTNVFNVFTLMQIFNLINCRVINDELNIFTNIHRSTMFLIVWLGIFGLHIVIIEQGSFAMKVSKYGLAWQ